MTLFSIKRNSLYDQDSLTKKARNSLCNLLSSSLKRKRSFAEEEQQDGPIIKKKKKKVNSITRLFQKMVVVSSSNTVIKREKSKLLFDALYTFETFSLPTIEATGGSLGIALKEPVEESIFSTIEGSFPTPPAKTTTTTTRRLLRRDSCPPRLNSLVSIEEESDDDDTLPLTPSSSNVEHELVMKILELII